MGNQILEAKNQSKELEKMLSRFHIIQHDTAKNVILMEEITTQQQYTLRQITTNDQNQKISIQQLIEKKLAAKSPYLSRLDSYLMQKQKNYCSNQFKTYLLFEAHAKNLKFQILEHRLRKIPFDQSQIVNTIQSCVFALKFLREINHPHQAICSANIFYNKEGKILLSDPWLNQQIIAFPSANHIYLSPEKLQQINNLRLQKVDWFSSDLFSLGVVILEMINLEFMDQLYIRNNKQLNRILLKQKVTEVKSQTVKKYLETLLLTDNNKRTDIVNEVSTNKMKLHISKNRNESRDKQVVNVILPQTNSDIKARGNNSITKDVPSLIGKKLQFNQSKNRQKSAGNDNNSNNYPQQPIHFMINNRQNSQNIIGANNHLVSNNYIHGSNMQNNTKLHVINSNHDPKNQQRKNNLIIVTSQNSQNLQNQQNFQNMQNTQNIQNIQNVQNIKNPQNLQNIQNSQNTQKRAIEKSTPIINNNNNQVKINFVNRDQKNKSLNNTQQKILNTSKSSNINYVIQYNPFAKMTNNLPKSYYPGTTLNTQNNNVNISESNNHHHIANSSLVNSNLIVNSSINNNQNYQSRSTINSNHPISSISSNLSYGSNTIENQESILKLNIIQNEKSHNDERQQKKSQPIKPETILQTDHSYVNTSFPKLLQYSNINENELMDQKYLLSYQLEPVQQKTIESYQQTQEKQQQKINVTTPARRNKNINKYNSTIQEVSQRSCSPTGSVINQPQYIVQQYQIGSKYQGFKKNGMRNGKGTFYYQDGGFYEGQWKDNKMHGYGKLFYNQSHLAYEGDWYMDEFHGHGKVYNDNPITLEKPFDYRNFDQLDQYWQYYEGNLIKDTKEGLGMIKLSNGQIFEGQFHQDKIEGKGKYITMKGEIIHGIWNNSKLQRLIINNS